jgi:hypothetical protein
VERARRTGARIAIVSFFLIVAGVTLTWTVEIIQQVWFPKFEPANVSCRDGVRGLITAVERARHAADEETGGERAAVARFRDALDPEWEQRVGLTQVCRGDALGEKALIDVDRLRYAEEHATRYEAADLARRRRGIRRLERELAQH